MTVLEACLQALLAALNTGRPALVPVVERDRWIDVETGPTSAAVVALAGFEDEPQPGQQDDRFVDFRTARLMFEIWASKTAGATAVEVLDAATEWLGRQCGPVEAATLVAAGATRVTLAKRTAVVAKGDGMRGLVELALEYRNLTNDLTRAK